MRTAGRTVVAAIGHGYCCFLLLLLTAWRCHATLPFTFQSWTTRQGLPENQVTCLAQTRDGYLWVGTEDGLARFDGIRFVNFGFREGLNSTRIRTLFEDHEGTLWIGTIQGGLFRLRDGKIEAFGREEGLTGGIINQLTEDSSGRLWVAATHEVMVWQNGKPVSLDLPAELQKQNIIGLLCDHTGTMWLAPDRGGLWQYRDGMFNRFTDPAMPAEAQNVGKLWEDHAGRLWICAGENKLFCRDLTGWKEYAIPLDIGLPMLKSIGEEADGTIWAGSVRNGLYSVRDGRLDRITTQDGLSANAIEAVLVDREDNLWIGTTGGGLNRLTHMKVRAFGVNEGLRFPYVRGVAEIAPGELWVGTRGDGLYHWQNGSFNRVQFEGALKDEVYFNALLQTHDGSTWAATGHGIYRFVDGKPEYNPEWSKLFQDTANVALCEDRGGGVWAGAGARLWHLQNGQAEMNTNVVVKHGIIAIAQDSRGSVWLGTEGDGLYRITGNQVSHVCRTNGLNSDIVRALHFDASDTLWIGTAGGGLTRYKDGHFFTVDERQGLPDDTVSQILEDDSGCLWIGGNRGIVRIARTDVDKLAAGNIQTIFPTVLTTEDGLPSEECTGTYSPAGLKLGTGELCFTTLKGIVLVDPKQERQVTPPPDVWLEEVMVDGELHDLQTASREQTATNDLPPSVSWMPITLAPGKHRLEFHYTGLNFAAPDQIRFRYQLTGLDSDWIEAGSQRVAHYNYIPPGSYIFRVIACNKDGVWNETGATLALTVQPFLWQRSWFSTIVSFVAMALVAGIIVGIERRKRHQERARLSALHALEQERTRIANDIHDDLGATLSAIRFLSKFGQAPEVPVERLRDDMRQIASKALESTQALDEIVWAVDPHSDSLESFVNYACTFAAEQLGLADIRCRQDIPAIIPVKTLQAEARHNLFLAFKEAITNILKHAEATEVQIKMETGPHAFDITITDNGCGMSLPAPAVTGSSTGGHGLPNLHDRLRGIGGTCEMTSLPGQGVTVRFHVTL